MKDFRRLQFGAFLSFALLLLTGCPETQIIAKTPTVADADEQQATCQVARDPLNPLVVEWPGTAKVDMEAASRRGLVAVSYAGCQMKILSGCEIEGGYELEETTPARDRLEISDNNELYAKLPLGAASLKGELSAGAALELDYIAVGQRVANDTPKRSKGSCEGATHYVRTITVGAFRLDAKAKGKVGASVEVGSAGGGIGREENVHKLRAQGDVEACVKKPNSPDCGAILQLGLAPLNINKGGALASAGFGDGLDPVAQLEDVSDVDLDAAQTSNLASVDVDLYELLDIAVKAEKNTTLSAERKSQAWKNLAEYRNKKGKNPLEDKALERVDAWSIRAEQEERQKVALEKLKLRYLEDKSKLNKILSMDDTVIKPEQKVAYRKEFEEVYGTRKKELAMVGIGGTASTSGGSGAAGGGASSSTTADEGAEVKIEKGIAGWGHFAIEADAMIGNGAITDSIVSIDSTTSKLEHLGDGDVPVCSGGSTVDGQCQGFVSPGNFLLGVTLGLTELIPGGFGFYGDFRAWIGKESPLLSAGGGIRWDYRVTPRGTFTLGVGGGYAFTAGSAFYIDANDDGIRNDNELSVTRLGGPQVDAFGGIGYNNGAFTAQFRALFTSAFLGGSFTDANNKSHEVDVSGATLGGGIGAGLGVTL